MVWMIVRIVAITYVCLLLIMCACQSRLVYFPSRQVQWTPDVAGLEYEAVTLVASDGVKTSAWFVPATKPRGVVLFCHGNAGNISHRLDTMQLHHSLGLSSLHIDYRGYGQSEGKPSEQGTYRDAEAAWRYLTETRKIPAGQIIIHGRSLGGGVAAWLAAKHAPRGLILESTFTSVPDLGAELYPFLPVRLVARIHYDTRKRLADIKCPVLIVHSPQDEIIPYRHGRRLFEAAREPKTFLEIQGGHNEGWAQSGQQYKQGIDAFVTACLAGGGDEQ